MPDEKSIVVDEDDNVIAYKSRSELSSDDRWRVSSVWLRNSAGQLLIARRHPSKKVHPNMWGPSAAGTVEAHESYEDNAVKELREELGVQEVSLKCIHTGRLDGTDGTKRFTANFVGLCDWPEDKFTLEEGQVAEVKWVDQEWLLQDIIDNPNNYTPSCYFWPELFKLG